MGIIRVLWEGNFSAGDKGVINISISSYFLLQICSLGMWG
jgi:hypothetical protein